MGGLDRRPGLLHSLGKVALVGRMHLPCESPADCISMDQSVAQWLALARRHCLEGHREGIGNCATYPKRPEHAEQLIRPFEIERHLTDLQLALHKPSDTFQLALKALESWPTLTQRG